MRIYGAVDFVCAFVVGGLSGAAGLSCTTRGALICAACLVNLAHAALVRPAARALDNVLGGMTALLVFASPHRASQPTTRPSSRLLPPLPHGCICCLCLQSPPPCAASCAERSNSRVANSSPTHHAADCPLPFSRSFSFPSLAVFASFAGPSQAGYSRGGVQEWFCLPPSPVNGVPGNVLV